MNFRVVPKISKTHNGRTLVLKGGWKAPLPAVKVSSLDSPALISSWTGHGLNPTQAERAVHNTTQEVFWRGWFYHLKWFVIHWMCYYADAFPHLVNEDGTLRGFDPEALVMFWLPLEKEFGRDGKQYIREILFEMSKDQGDQMEIFGQ